MRKIINIAILCIILIYPYSLFSAESESEDIYNQKEIKSLISKVNLLKKELELIKRQQQNKKNKTDLGLTDLEASLDSSSKVGEGVKDGKEYIIEKIDSQKVDSREISSVDVGDEVRITSQGQVTYIGSYSSDNTIPIGQLPSSLFASSILRQRNYFEDYCLFFGGFLGVESQVVLGDSVKNKITGRQTKGNIENVYLSSATLFFLSNVGHYLTTEFSFQADQDNLFVTLEALAIFGNLDTSPWFVTVGKYRPSLGSYGGGGPWTAGLTANMFRPIRVNALALNYNGETSNANISLLNSENNPNFSVAYFDAVSFDEVLQVGYNVGYMHDIRNAALRFRNIDSRVGEFNIDGTVNYSPTFLPGSINLGAGWATTTNKNAQFNGQSKELAGAFTVQSAYGFRFYGKNQNINISYGHSYNANNLSMPISALSDNFIVSPSGIEDQILLSTQRSYFNDNVLVGPEYSFQKLYDGKIINSLTLDISIFI